MACDIGLYSVHFEIQCPVMLAYLAFHEGSRHERFKHHPRTRNSDVGIRMLSSTYVGKLFSTVMFQLSGSYCQRPRLPCEGCAYVLHRVMLYYTILYSIIFQYMTLHYLVFHYIMLCYIVPHYSI